MKTKDKLIRLRKKGYELEGSYEDGYTFLMNGIDEIIGEEQEKKMNEIREYSVQNDDECYCQRCWKHLKRNESIFHIDDNWVNVCSNCVKEIEK